MSSSSKLDYLSKYYSSSSAAAADHYAEKGQKKEKKKKRSRSENQSTAGTLQIIDDQSDMLPRPLIHRDRFQKMEKEENESLHRRKRFDSSDSESELNETEEDGPLVVQLDNRSSDVQLPQTMNPQLHKHHHHHSKKQRRYDSDDDDAADEKRGQQQTQNDTVYRDKQGKKLNIKDEQDKHQKQVQESLELQQKQKILLNMGGAQKALIEARSTEFKDIQQSSFARGIDDEQLEDWRRNQVRDGDPMASYMSSSKNAASSSSSSKQRNQDTLLQQHPRYKGPTPKPNRFLLPPGYRWDGVDRGNGFEDLVLAKTNVKSQEREDAYKRSTADM